jgi:hypothetical protein
MVKFRNLVMVFSIILLVLVANYPVYSVNVLIESEAKLSEDCRLDYVVEGQKEVSVYVCDREIGGRSVMAHAVVNGSVIKIEESHTGVGEDIILLHELGHNIGYKHSYGDIMDPRPAKSYEKELTNIEKDIAKSFKGFRIINWHNSSDIEYLKDSSGRNDFESIIKTMKGKNCESIFYKESIYKDRWGQDRFYNLCY